MAISTFDPTRYEVALTAPGINMLVCYSAAKSNSALMRILQSYGKAILRVAGDHIAEEDVITVERGRINLAPGVRISFTGRTQRDAKASPLPFIGG